MAESAWTEYPLVSGLLVFNRPGQELITHQSIRSFFAQSWPNKELVVYNPTLLRFRRRFFEHRPLKEIRLTICDMWLMLAVCHAQANGEWCAIWRSDCVYDPGYLAEHMAHRQKDQLVILKNRTVMAVEDRSTSVISSTDFPTYSFYRHISVDFQKPLAEQFNTLARENAASLITQIVSEIAQ